MKKVMCIVFVSMFLVAMLPSLGLATNGVVETPPPPATQRDWDTPPSAQSPEDVPPTLPQSQPPMHPTMQHTTDVLPPTMPSYEKESEAVECGNASNPSRSANLADSLGEYISGDVLYSFVEYVDANLIMREDAEAPMIIWIAWESTPDDGWPVGGGASGYRLESLFDVLSRDDFFGRTVYAPEAVYDFLEGMGLDVKDVLVPVNQEYLVVLTGEGTYYLNAQWRDLNGTRMLFVEDEDVFNLIYQMTVGG